MKVPQADAGGTGDMTATYYANDLARSITQDGKTQTLELDPMLRSLTKTKSGGWSGTESYAYSDDSDSPAWLQDGSSWTRWISGLDGSVAATQTSSGALGWTVSNKRGDMVAEAGGVGLLNIREIDEFGLVRGGLPSTRPYGFHGSRVRETLTDGGTIAMGVRLYVPASGRFVQSDPVLGGTANPYEYPSDPVGRRDLTGKYGEDANPAERKYCSKRSPRRKYRCYKASALADKARKSAERNFPDSLHNGAGDAFRHCFWSGMMTQRWGSKQAKTFTDLHERDPNQPTRERRMDIRNNWTGPLRRQFDPALKLPPIQPMQ